MASYSYGNGNDRKQTVMEPKVSVIVCTYNHEDTVGAALDSILAQRTDFDFEIVVSDDCSADGTADIVRSYAARYPDRVRAIFNAENKGVADNYFDTLYECRGRYIADLAGDDVWTDTGKLARQAALMDSDPSIVLCHGAWCFLHPDGSMSEPSGYAKPASAGVVEAGEAVPLLLQHRRSEFFIHLCTSMYRRDTAIALTQKYSEFFYGRDLPCEDLQLEVLMAANGRIAYDPAPVLAYRVGHDSVSSPVNMAKNAVFTARIVALTLRLADELCADKSALAPYFDGAMTYAASRALISGSAQAAAECSRTASLLAPHRLPAKVRVALALMRSRFTHTVSRFAYKLIPR